MRTNEEFAAIIISHGRANDLKTYKTLKRMKYRGKLYIVIDDEDEQQELYKEKYGDAVVVFSKQEYMKKSDTVDNFRKKSTALYARNFSYDLAKRLGLKCFLLLDDDITDFIIRYDDGKKLANKKIKDINSTIDAMTEFLYSCDEIKGFSFGSNGNNIGGLKGGFKNKLGRVIYQAMFLKVEDDIRFKGTQAEDMDIAFLYAEKGYLFFQSFELIVVSPQRGTNSGGNDYNGQMYASDFYGVIIAPYGVKMKR